MPLKEKKHLMLSLGWFLILSQILTKRTVKKRKLCIDEILTVFITRGPFACFNPQSSLRFEGRKTSFIYVEIPYVRLSLKPLK